MAEEIKENQNQDTEKKEPEVKEKKKSKKDAEIEGLKAELEKSKDLLLRTAAEFDNFKKRTDRERTGVAEYAKAEIIKKLLPIIDNIGRASGADKESPDYIKGIEMIVKQFQALIETLELSKVASAGDTFDPNLHDAVMHIEDENLGDNVIAEVLQQGYKFGETVVRPAMVKVAN